ncbi:chitobiase/beta-hexosaminidase C-terminal domain-containing protein [bacterium]|nr:chitobiase/beta-hexosaminidase C-terminal domain-containing protein [bacterium]
MKNFTFAAALVLAIPLAVAGCSCGDDDDDDDGGRPGLTYSDFGDDDTQPGDDDSFSDDDFDDDDFEDDDIDDDLDDDDTDDDDIDDDDIDDDADDDTVDPEAPVTTATPDGGWFNDTIGVTLTAVDNDDPTPTIYYTTDGSDPVPGGGTTMSGPTPVTISGVLADTTVKFFAIDVYDNEELPQEELYRFDYEGPVCVTDPDSGTYGGPYAPLGIGPLQVTVNCTDLADTDPEVYYTLDGSDPVPGQPGTFTEVAPFSLEFPGTTALKILPEDFLGNLGLQSDYQFDILYYDNFESWTIGSVPGAPWSFSNDPWNGTFPRVWPLFTPPGGSILQILDDNLSFDGIRETWASLYFEEPAPLPDTYGVQVSMRIRADTHGGFGTYYTEDGISHPWRMMVFFRDGDIKAYDHSLGAWVTCLAGIAYDEWYAIDVMVDRVNASYEVKVDQAATACVNLETYYEGVGLPGDMTGVKFATEGPPEGTVEFDAFRGYTSAP